jgi:predicted DNA-binding transcriptional regulator YafY
VSAAQYPCQAKIRLLASAEQAAQHFPPGTGVLEATGPDQCVLTTGAYSLDDIAMYLGVLDVEFTVLEPAELRSRVEAVADRFHRAVQREAGTTVPSERRGVRQALGNGGTAPS